MRREKGVILGVCSGIGNHIEVDPVFIRMLFVLFTILGHGWPILIYFILALCMPAQ
jgi:phage shock protein C